MHEGLLVKQKSRSKRERRGEDLRREAMLTWLMKELDKHEAEKLTLNAAEFSNRKNSLEIQIKDNLKFVSRIFLHNWFSFLAFGDNKWQFIFWARFVKKRRFIFDCVAFYKSEVEWEIASQREKESIKFIGSPFLISSLDYIATKVCAVKRPVTVTTAKKKKML